MPASAEWNPLVPQANRLDSPNRNSRKPASLLPTHVVIHVTGTDSLDDVRRTFLARNSVSAHYLVGKDGSLYQFVPDAHRAWHAGIDSNTRRIYRRGAAQWTRYLKYFNWYGNYPTDSGYVDGDLRPVWDQTEAAFVTRAGGGRWAEYDYFFTRCPGRDAPVNFEVDPDPNNYSIGIETLGFGAKAPDPQVYPDAMYETLRKLLADLAARYSIPLTRDRVVGHEDVNPIARFGWDPNAGFEWSRIL